MNETFWGLIPICSNSLGSELDLVLVLIQCLAQTKISDFDFSIMEYNVLGLEIVVYDFLLLVVEVFHTRQNLGDYKLGFFLNDLLILF